MQTYAATFAASAIASESLSPLVSMSLRIGSSTLGSICILLLLLSPIAEPAHAGHEGTGGTEDEGRGHLNEGRQGGHQAVHTFPSGTSKRYACAHCLCRRQTPRRLGVAPGVALEGLTLGDTAPPRGEQGRITPSEDLDEVGSAAFAAEDPLMVAAELVKVAEQGRLVDLADAGYALGLAAEITACEGSREAAGGAGRAGCRGRTRA